MQNVSHAPRAYISPDASRSVFRKMSRHLDKLADHAKAEDVHRFRTNSRRVEALIADLAPESRNKRKLLKLLAKLRKRAGMVRDLDVQIAFLNQLTLPDRQKHRGQLLAALAEEHAQRSRKLAKSLTARRVRQLRKRLRRAQSEITLDGIDPLRFAFRHLPNPDQNPLTEKTLHAYRVHAKHARYLAELAPDSNQARSLVAELKRAQDEIGHWHDILKLSERARELFGDVHDSALVSLLQNMSRATFRRAGKALLAAIEAVSPMRDGHRRTPPVRPAPEEVVRTQSAAA
ncbi:MAG: CHAD domain-containing protein [Acidobacteria bacterium]|nr:CHAD domain-containing protein [Acidobacteriota bacterium]